MLFYNNSSHLKNYSFIGQDVFLYCWITFFGTTRHLNAAEKVDQLKSSTYQKSKALPHSAKYMLSSFCIPEIFYVTNCVPSATLAE